MGGIPDLSRHAEPSRSVLAHRRLQRRGGLARGSQAELQDRFQRRVRGSRGVREEGAPAVSRRRHRRSRALHHAHPRISHRARRRPASSTCTGSRPAPITSGRPGAAISRISPRDSSARSSQDARRLSRPAQGLRNPAGRLLDAPPRLLDRGRQRVVERVQIGDGQRRDDLAVESANGIADVGHAGRDGASAESRSRACATFVERRDELDCERRDCARSSNAAAPRVRRRQVREQHVSRAARGADR